MYYACATRFDVTRNLKNFVNFFKLTNSPPLLWWTHALAPCPSCSCPCVAASTVQASRPALQLHVGRPAKL